MKSVFDLELHSFQTRWPDQGNRDLCEKAYMFWQQSWRHTFRLLTQQDSVLYSDDFLDREVVCLAFRGEPIGLFFCNWFDVSRVSHVSHTYFKNYPRAAIEFITKECNGLCMVLTYMTVHEDWRSKLTNLSVPDLLFSLCINKYIESSCENLIGYIRRDKSFSNSFYDHGAISIVRGEVYNVPVDFCYLPRAKAQLSSAPGVRDAVHRLINQNHNRGATSVISTTDIRFTSAEA